MVLNFYPQITPGSLEVDFINLSIAPDNTVFTWNFGDGSSLYTGFDAVHNYSVEAPRGGNFTVTLSATTGDGDPETFTYSFGLSPTVGIVPIIPIKSFVKLLLPVSLQQEDQLIDTTITKWQIQLALGAGIAPAEVLNPFAWPFVYQQLISYLTVLDILFSKANEYLLSQAGTSAGSGSSSGIALKAVETGPSRAEWFQTSEDWYNLMKPGGLYSQTLQWVCILAGALTIKLEYCKQSNTLVIPPEVLHQYTPNNRIHSYVNRIDIRRSVADLSRRFTGGS